ncbi:hypothetical protein [Psychroserpens damuponensis]|uniref:hypothetical protein n=1 Tax=Psychroserpens damuponensis TaxID=943936 RepID=UPI00059027CF|nr:hypothetical protein [Psychroserpens damuponensis]
MDSLIYISSVLKNEKIIVKIKKKSDIGFWKYQFFGFLSMCLNSSKDFFIITENKIILLLDDKLIKKLEYLNFSQIKFNAASSELHFINSENKNKSLNLSRLRLTYEEIQYLKSKLNA